MNFYVVKQFAGNLLFFCNREFLMKFRGVGLELFNLVWRFEDGSLNKCLIIILICLEYVNIGKSLGLTYNDTYLQESRYINKQESS